MKVAVIIGSGREKRFAEKPAKWIHQLIAKRPDVEVELLDLRDYPMPFFDHALTPSQKQEPYPNEVVERWTQKIASADAYVIVSPEYNHSFSAVVKNAMDWVLREWARKPVTFVGYGNANGARAVQQLRLVAIELQMAPIRNAVHVPLDALIAHFKGEPVEEKLAAVDAITTPAIDELLWWAKALKTARG